MKKYIVVFVCILYFIVPLVTDAHSGNTDVYGCHTCYTNCTDYGLYTGQYHCHNTQAADAACAHLLDQMATQSFIEKSIAQCIENYNSSHWTEPPASYSNTTETSKGYSDTPSQSIESDSVSDWVDSAMDEWCKDTYGRYSFNNQKTEKCECKSGYDFDTEAQCVPEDTARKSRCESIYGQNVLYNEDNDGCICEEGYSLSSITNTCALTDKICKENNNFDPNIVEIGFNTRVCGCRDGFSWNGKQCVVKVTSPTAQVPVEAPAKVEQVKLENKSAGIATTPTNSPQPILTDPATSTVQVDTAQNQESQVIEETESPVTETQENRPLPWYKKIWKFIWRF